MICVQFNSNGYCSFRNHNMSVNGKISDITQKDILVVRDDNMDIERTAFLIDSVFKFRGLGDGTAYINNESRQNLSNYNSIFMRLALSMRDTERAIHYADMGIRQFPEEWRNYAIAAELLSTVGQIDRAVEYLEKGLEYISDGSGNRYLRQQLSNIKTME